MVREISNFLPQGSFWLLEQQMKQAKFTDVVSQDQKYSDISQDFSTASIMSAIEKHTGQKVENVLSFLRAYVDRPEYRHPMWIHSDVMFSDYIGILFLQSSEFPEDDGVAQWRNRQLNSLELTSRDPDGEANKIVDSQSRDPKHWELMRRFEFERNKMVIMPSSYFHSTMTYGHHGKDLDTCRIVMISFYNIQKPKEQENV